MLTHSFDLLLAAAFFSVAPVAAAQAVDFEWSGRVAPGRVVQIRNVNGEIHVQPAAGDRVEVVGVKRVRRGDPGRVRIEASRFGAADADVLVCAIWGEGTTCDVEGYHSRGRGMSLNEDIRVDFTVRLPAGVRARLESTNGAITVTGAAAEVIAETTNGDISIAGVAGPITAETTNGDISVRSARGPVRAEAVNGTIGVEVDPSSPTADVALETVNGAVNVWVASTFQGTIDMETTHGTVHTDFPVTVQGRFDPRHIRARVGSGAGRIWLATVNGDLSLRKPR